MIGRRQIPGTAGRGLAVLAAPRTIAAQGSRVLKFVPQADLAYLNPVQTTALATGNHGMMVFDTLYSVDADLKPQPQMVSGHVIEDGGKVWRLTLRVGLRFHDGSPVLARDCVVSMKRWSSRDVYASTLAGVTEELTAPSDTEIRFRLKRPFRLLPDVLAKPGSNIRAIMPEHLAMTPGTTQITEMVGSGPYRFITADRNARSLAAYDKFTDDRPHPDGVISYIADPKIAHLDRVERHTLPDAAMRRMIPHSRPFAARSGGRPSRMCRILR